MNLLVQLCWSLFSLHAAITEKSRCPYPNNMNAVRWLQTPQIPSNQCPECTALLIAPLLLEQLLNRVSTGNWAQVLPLMADDPMYTATLQNMEDPTECCQESVGCLPELFTNLTPALLQARAIQSKYNHKDGSVLQEFILSAVSGDGKRIERIFRGKMLWTSEDACDYRAAYSNVVELICQKAMEDTRRCRQQGCWPF